VRASILLLVVLGGCVADAEDPAPVERMPTTMEVMQSSTGDQEQDLCALATQLPSEDVCSLMCDPAAMEARLLDEGNATGVCYELYCDLPGDAFALVGVCL